MFFAKKGFYPQMSVELNEPLISNIREINADFFDIKMEKIQKILQDNILLARVDKKRHSN